MDEKKSRKGVRFLSFLCGVTALVLLMLYMADVFVPDKIEPGKFAAQVNDMGVGEIVINSIDQDGMMRGYDEKLIQLIFENSNIPISALGGSGSLEHMGNLINKFGIIGTSAGSFFVFKGKYRAVLINYPRPDEKDQLISNFLNK